MFPNTVIGGAPYFEPQELLSPRQHSLLLKLPEQKAACRLIESRCLTVWPN
jgi:hypothetical protein